VAPRLDKQADYNHAGAKCDIPAAAKEIEDYDMISEPERDRQQQLAEERTDIAYQRTWLAEERTFSAWLRTGLASLATGFVIAKLMVETGPTWLMRALGALFILVGGAVFCLALLAYRSAVLRLGKPPTSGIPMWVIGSISAALVLGATIALLVVFL
jgi:putative membrane protein